MMTRYILCGCSALLLISSCSQETPNVVDKVQENRTTIQYRLTLQQPTWEGEESLYALRFDGSDEGYPVLNLLSSDFDDPSSLTIQTNSGQTIPQIEKTPLRWLLRVNQTDGSLKNSWATDLWRSSSNQISIDGTPGSYNMNMILQVTPTEEFYRGADKERAFNAFFIGGIPGDEDTNTPNATTRQYFSEATNKGYTSRSLTAPNFALAPVKSGVILHRNLPLMTPFLKASDISGSGQETTSTGYGKFEMRGTLIAVQITNGLSDEVTVTYLKPTLGANRPFDYEGYFDGNSSSAQQGQKLAFVPSYLPDDNATGSDVTTSERQSLSYPIYTVEAAKKAIENGGIINNTTPATTPATPPTDPDADDWDGEGDSGTPSAPEGEGAQAGNDNGVVIPSNGHTDGRILFWGMPREAYKNKVFTFRLVYNQGSNKGLVTKTFKVSPPKDGKGFQEGKVYRANITIQ